MVVNKETRSNDTYKLISSTLLSPSEVSKLLEFCLNATYLACQYHWCSIYRGLERVGSWVPGGSVGRDQLAMAAKVRRHWFNPCRLGSWGHLGANFSLLLYTDLIKKRKPSRKLIVSSSRQNQETSHFIDIQLAWF